LITDLFTAALDCSFPIRFKNVAAVHRFTIKDQIKQDFSLQEEKAMYCIGVNLYTHYITVIIFIIILTIYVKVIGMP